MYGNDLQAIYFHDIDDDHFHDEDEDISLENNGLWLADHIELTSVGIDIGSASTQIVFSKITLHRMGGDLSSRYNVVARECLYRSPIHFTPYANQERIDDSLLGNIIRAEYALAGLTPGEVDTGAVILTGEAIRRQNAEAIAHMLSHQGGHFVCAVAGHNMEALLAAYGSGAVYASYQQKTRLLNIDIGGGTTKFAVVENGKVVETAAMHVGGRLLVTDENDKLIRLDPAAEQIAASIGVKLTVGVTISSAVKERLAGWMADRVLQAIQPGDIPVAVEDLYLTSPLKNRGPFAGVLFSGGVGEYVYEPQQADFGDLGRYLGAALARNFAENPSMGPVHLAEERIRATVIGASEYSVQISGNTIYLSSPRVLPVRNVQVLHPHCDLHGEINADEVASQIRAHFKRFDRDASDADVALSFHWGGVPEYPRIRAFCEGLQRALQSTSQTRRQLTIVLDGDIAQTVGIILQTEFCVDNPLLILDGIQLQDFDFIDIGNVIQPAGVVPVTIKSLVFELNDNLAGRH